MNLFAPRVLLHDGWARNVVIKINDAGVIDSVRRDVGTPAAGMQTLGGPVLPGIPNLHSHAFQRAFAGYSERRSSGHDSFWTWRKVLYDFLSQVSPDHLQAIAEQLFVEMLKAGYTAVGEFHYLHHGPDGRPYDSPTEMSDRVIHAAQTAGIALTHLPVLYAYGGFGAQPPARAQRRFLNDIDCFGDLVEALYKRHGGGNVRLGVAPHSLRAVDLPLLRDSVELLTRLDPGAPIHLHIAEQAGEVEDCVSWCAKRPVEWLFDNIEVDQRWCLVHGTHTVATEVEAMAKSGCVVGLCPTTEANLGDGIFAAADFAGRGGRFGIGSDSNVSVSPIEELRTLEYGQRLWHGRRAVLASDDIPSVGANLYKNAAQGGAQALGWPSGVLQEGKRADLIVLDSNCPALINKSDDLLLDALVFAGNTNPVKDVMVGGQWRIIDGRHEHEEAILQRFVQVQKQVVSDLID